MSRISCQEGWCLDGNVANSMGSKGNFKCTEQFEDSTIQHHCRHPFEQWNISGWGPKMGKHEIGMEFNMSVKQLNSIQFGYLVLGYRC